MAIYILNKQFHHYITRNDMLMKMLQNIKNLFENTLTTIKFNSIVITTPLLQQFKIIFNENTKTLKRIRKLTVHTNFVRKINV